MNEPTDTQMLDWCALYLEQANVVSNEPKRKKWVNTDKVEIIANDEGDQIIATATGSDMVDAFRRAVKDAMKQLPRKQSS